MFGICPAHQHPFKADAVFMGCCNHMLHEISIQYISISIIRIHCSIYMYMYCICMLLMYTYIYICMMYINVHDYIYMLEAYFRQHVQPPLPVTRNAVDRYVRLLLTAAGPTYCNEVSLGVKIFARRVRNRDRLSRARASPRKCEKHLGQTTFALCRGWQ